MIIKPILKITLPRTGSLGSVRLLYWWRNEIRSLTLTGEGSSWLSGAVRTREKRGYWIPQCEDQLGNRLSQENNNNPCSCVVWNKYPILGWVCMTRLWNHAPSYESVDKNGAKSFPTFLTPQPLHSLHNHNINPTLTASESRYDTVDKLSYSGNLLERERLSLISCFCGNAWKFSLRNLGAWHPLAQQKWAIREYRIFH